MQVVASLRIYASYAIKDTAIVMAIDDQFKADRSSETYAFEGRHRFFDGESGRVSFVLQWCKAIQLPCEQVPTAKQTQPLPKPRTYCGYIRSITSHQAGYTARCSTVWLVGFVESAFGTLYPKKCYSIHAYRIAYITQPSEIKYAERTLTHCTESRVKFGGFCVAPPR